MIKIEILSDLNGAPLGRTEHMEPTPKAAQEWAAHWTHEIVEGGFIPEGAVVTYVLTEETVFSNVPKVIDVISYLHTNDAEVTTE
jgi:hypothetical protein